MLGWNHEYKIYSELDIKSMWFETKNNRKRVCQMETTYNQESKKQI